MSATNSGYYGNKNSVKHGMFGTRFYRIWTAMKSRCLNTKTPDYPRYGGRGITVCKEWFQFINFKNDMYESYLQHVEQFGEKDTQIDRVNNKEGYSVSNCRWATWAENQANKTTYKTQRKFKAVSPQGVEYVALNQRKFAREHNLSASKLNWCLQQKYKDLKGWTFSYLDNIE